MARPKKSSNYKVIQDIDLSKNNMYNVNAIVGNSYDFEPNDLIITTYDTDEASPPANAGNLILRAGVADESLANSGSVHIFAGNEVTPTTDSTVIDILSSSSSSSLTGVNSRVKNGITVDPNEGVFIKSEISNGESASGTVSIEAKEALNIESHDDTTFTSPNVTKAVTAEEDTVGTLTETFTTKHTETAKELSIQAGSYGDPISYTLTVESNHGKNETDPGHSYINADEIVVDKIVTEGNSDAKVVRTTCTSSDTNTSELYELHAGGSNSKPDTLTIQSNLGKTDTDQGQSYINVDKIKVDGTVTEGENADGKRVVREVHATTDTTKVSKHLSITAPAFSLDAERKATDTEETEESSLEVTNITSTNNNLENLTLGGEKDTLTGKIPTGEFVVHNNSVDIDTNTLNINVPNTLTKTDANTGGIVFELSADNESSLMHIDNVNIDKTLLIGKDSTDKSESAEIYTNKFVLDTNTENAKDDTNTENAKDTGLSITGNYGLKITDHHHPTSDSTESYINVNHINVGTVDVVTDKANDVIVYNSIKTDKTTDRTTNTDKAIDVILTGNSKGVSVNNDDATNKIHDVEIHSETINIKGGSKNNLHITSSLTDGEVGRLNTKGLVAGDSFIETDDLIINKNFYANQFYIYWDDRINSLVFANSEQTPKG